MAKKRKAGSRSEASAKATETDFNDVRSGIQSYEDIADSDDEFHLNRDEILLGEEPETKRRRKEAEREEFLEQSDEEVLGYSDGEESEASYEDNPTSLRDTSKARNDSDKNPQNSDDEDEDGYGWGTSRADLYGADAIETEEQAIEEEAEARRLQKKQLEAMRAADYGFDEDDWAHDDAAEKNSQKKSVIMEVLPSLSIDADMSEAERLKLLRSRYPEFDLLSRDFLDLQEQHTRLSQAARSPVNVIKLRAISAYTGALAMYFSLLSSTASSHSGAAALSASELRNHPVMDDLLACRTLWADVSELKDTDDRSSRQMAGAADVESEEDLSDTSAIETVAAKVPAKAKMSRAERHAAAARAAEDERRAQHVRKTDEDLADLDALLATSRKSAKNKSRTSKQSEMDTDLGEAAPLSAQEAADKAQRKKSLRFYASQIAQKANKRGAAGRSAGGDDDIPYRERLRDRQARLNAEAEKRGKRDKNIGDDLGGESDEEDSRRAKEIREDGDDEYYDLVAARTQKKKSDKSALAEAQRQAALQGGHVVQEETVAADGKRKISYAIEKNKGLTPHRKKDVRNPRVKKRKKFEEKKKKLASIKPIYKGGEGRGGYGGELTGIKKGLVKSTKL